MAKCECLKHVYDGLRSKFPEINELPDNVELISNREFSTYSFKTKVRGRKPITLLYGYCPHCGKKYSE